LRDGASVHATSLRANVFIDEIFSKGGADELGRLAADLTAVAG
jgi:hypothetical protein